MMNMQNMMKQAQKLQKQMEKSQAELAATTFTGKSAQDLVVAELTGDKKVVNITFADAVVDPDDVETLQDMTVQALNDALGQIDEATKKSIGAFAGKLPIQTIKRNLTIPFSIYSFSNAPIADRVIRMHDAKIKSVELNPNPQKIEDLEY